MSIKANYKDEEIEYYDWNDTWGWGDYRNASIKKVMEYIDRAFKKELKPTEAYYFGYRLQEGTPEIVIATSPASDKDDYWWIKRRGKREKSGPIFAMTPENDEVLKRIQEQALTVASEQEKLNGLYKELRRLSVNDLKQKSEVAA